VYRTIKLDGSYSKKEVLINDIGGGGHVTRTIVIGPDEKIYVSIGSTCNVCEETDPNRAAVVQYNLDGSGGKLFASGLRNSVGIVFHYSNALNKSQLWSVDNGRDDIGDNLPLEEVNIIEQGKNYGWPYCHSFLEVNPEFPERFSYCKMQTQPPAFGMQAHSAPLSISFPPLVSAWQGLSNVAFIAFHGSWNRTVPTGYKVVHLDTTNSNSQTIDFISGWYETDGNVWGRPVDIKFDSTGRMFISDDKAGAIYLVTKN
jgi:glucose/arabinose dehydrogenase